jgi:hypothetical protein
LHIHSEEKPYQCEICHKKFREKGNMKTHVKTHEAKKKISPDINSISNEEKKIENINIKEAESFNLPIPNSDQTVIDKMTFLNFLQFQSYLKLFNEYTKIHNINTNINMNMKANHREINPDQNWATINYSNNQNLNVYNLMFNGSNYSH